jgi:hypothetical protein
MLRAMHRGLMKFRGAVALGTLMSAALLGTASVGHAGYSEDISRGAAADMFMRVQILNAPSFDSGEVNLASSGLPVGANWYFYNNPTGTFPALQDARYTGSGSVNGRTEDGVMPAHLGVSMVFTNNTASETLNFIVNYRMPLTAQYNNGVNWSANLTGTLAGNQANLVTLAGTPLFTAYIDGNAVGSEYPDPFNLFVGGGTADYDEGPPIAGFAGSATQDIGIRLAFSLTPGDSATFNGNITFTSVVPGPGAAALLGLAGLMTTRRRRR